MSVPSPTVLAQLPKPLLEIEGQTQFGPCYGLTGSRKRKRFEVAAAIDGETLNIYDVQAPRLLSSYAVPPTTTFTCPPCSIRIRGATGSGCSRYTVCATLRSECQIECFKETVEQSKTAVISPYARVIADQSAVVHIDFVPVVTHRGDVKPLPDVIVIHRDGTVRRISGDLQKVRWVSQSVPSPEERALPPEIVSAHWVSHAEASIALLRRRDDILKELKTSESSFLVLIYRNGDHQESGLRFGVFEVPATLRMGFSSATSGQQLRLLVSNTLPESKRFNVGANLQIDFHALSARLSIAFKDEMITYDLSTYAPSVASKLFFDDSHTSLLPLTNNLAAGALRSAVMVYDTHYQSIKARFELITKSRRRGPEDNARKPVRFISYFTKINTLVAVRGRNLLSFNLLSQRRNKEHAFRRGSLLIDSLGCSTYASARVTAEANAELGPGFSKALFVPNQLDKAGWEARKISLDQMAQQDRVEQFEHVMASEMQEVTAAEEKDRMQGSYLKLPSDDQFVRQDKVHYLLSKVFQISVSSPAVGTGTQRDDLVIAFFPPRLVSWLARHNHLQTSEIEHALSKDHSQPQLKLGAVVQSIMQQDPSLSLLAEYLQGVNLSGLEEAVTVIKMLIMDAFTAAHGEPPAEQLLLEHPRPMTPDAPTMSGEDVPIPGSQTTVAAGGWSSECITAMNSTLAIIQRFSTFRITSALRTHLDVEEILALIQFLRQQLFQSGNTSSFPSISDATVCSVLSLEITVSILSSCMDAVGPLGFLGSTFDQGLWQNLVPDLKTETSLALEGIEEATYLKGILQEMVRYGNAVSSTEVMPSDSPTHEAGKADTEAGTIIQMYAESGEEKGHGLPEHPSMLPLSLKMENGVSKTKKRKGGGEVMERSGRELQYLKSRNMGRYSFERLVV